MTALNDLKDGETTQVKGSGSNLYTLKNTAGVYSCTCPAWMHQGIAIERRTCKHLRAFRGDAAEQARLGTAELAGKPVRRPKPASDDAAASSDEASSGTEPPLLLAHKWEMDVDLAGWWMSEKLDGVRAYWDGEQFISRLGNAFLAPPWFTAKLPKTPLDGELWGGRKKFQRTVGIVKRQDRSDAWKEIRYLVFDAPSHPGGFEARLEHCRTVVTGDWADVHTHEVCRDVDHLREELARVEALGGEGLMMRKPSSRYEAGRSSTLLKVKSFHDAEARVIEHVAGAGRHKGRLGALVVELPNGTTFNVGTGFSDSERESPPKVGSVITFRYQELSDGGVPRFPSYVGVRIDLDWKTVVSQAGQEHKKVHGVPQRSGGTKAAAPAAEVKVAKPAPQTAARHFEFSDGDSNKFWEIALDGASFTTRYGKIGSNGQTTLKEFASPSAASAEAEKLIAEKTRKGYVESV